jgi:SSS family solute:Na+ symporter
MRALDLIIVAVYLTALIAMGLSLLATIVTSVTFIAYPGSAFGGDWSLLVPGMMFVLVLGLGGAVIVPFFRHAVHVSAYEYFGRRFGTGVRLYSSLTFAIGHFSKMGFVFYLLALTLAGMTDFAVDRVILFTAVVTIFYTLLGGIEAVVWSDVMQGFVLWLGILTSLGYLLFLPAAGPRAVLADAWQHHKMSLGSTALRLDKPTILVLVLYGFFFYLQKYTGDQTVVQRYLVARSDKSALRGIGLGAVLCLPVWTAFMLIGSLLWSFYRATGEKLPASIVKPDQVFPHFLLTHLPAGVSGIFIAALLGSAMAMLASDMNCLAAVAVEDFYILALPRSTDTMRLKAGKAVVLLSGFAAAFVALRIAHSEGSALALYYAITAIVAGGLAGLFLLAFLCPWATRAGAIAGIAVNLAFTLWASLTEGGGKTLNLGRFNFPWHDYMIGAVGHVLLLGVGVAVSLLIQSKPLAPELTLWGWLQSHRTAAPEAVTTPP